MYYCQQCHIPVCGQQQLQLHLTSNQHQYSHTVLTSQLQSLQSAPSIQDQDTYNNTTYTSDRSIAKLQPEDQPVASTISTATSVTPASKIVSVFSESPSSSESSISSVSNSTSPSLVSPDINDRAKEGMS